MAFTTEELQNDSERVKKLKSKFNSKYAVKISEGVQTENILLDQSKVIHLKDDENSDD